MGCPPMQWQELRNRDRTNVAKVNNVYLMGFDVIPLRAALAACTTDGDDAEPTHDELVERLDKVTMVAVAKGDAVTPRSSILQDWVRCMGLSERGTLPV